MRFHAAKDARWTWDDLNDKPIDAGSIPASANVPCTPYRTPSNLAFGDSAGDMVCDDVAMVEAKATAAKNLIINVFHI
jgi:hypothetical protein